MMRGQRAVFLVALMFLLLPASLHAAQVSISEIRTDHSGADVEEFVELSGPPGQSMDNMYYLVVGDGGISTASGTIEYVLDLTGLSIPADGYFVVAQASFSLGIADLTTDQILENSDNVTHLLVTGFSGSKGDDLDKNDDGTLDSTPWVSLLDKIALVEQENPPTNTEYHYGPPSIGPVDGFVPGHVFTCNGQWEAGFFELNSVVDTPGAPNWCLLRKGASNLGDRWRWLPWFGYFNLGSDPWTYHTEHGFLYPFGTTTASVVFWDSDMGAFWWTSDTQYPYVYRFSDGEWLWYEEGSSSPRWFNKLSDGSWESW